MSRIKEVFRAIYALIFERPMSRSESYAIALGTVVINGLVYYLVAKLCHSADPWFLAKILIIIIVAHEIGHTLVMEANGIKTHLIFGFIFGGAFPDVRYKDKFQGLTWSNLAAIYQAGVIMNCFVVLYSIYLYYNGNITGLQLGQITNLSGALILYNQLPIWIFDGGQFTRVLFDSISEDKDIWHAISIAGVVIIMGLTYNLLGMYTFTVSLPLIMWGLWNRANNDNPHGSNNRLAMSRPQQIGWSGVYLVLVCLGMTMLALTETWAV